MTKIRVDQLLVMRELAEDIGRAQALVLAGSVFSGEQRVEKAGQQVREDIALAVRGRPHPWVSRGGLKLDHGLDHFNLSVTGAVAIDVGASTGGFTDVLLSRGADKVFAVDVGRGQLDWSLRQDERVTVLERTNARHLTVDMIPDPAGVVVCDASFIGLKTVLPAAMALTSPQAILIALIKPQFEAERSEVGKGGVVRDPEIHARICDNISSWLSSLPDWSVLGITQSPIKGPEGNIEFLIGAQKN